jgi:diacylglycerol kinase family enzyme
VYPAVVRLRQRYQATGWGKWVAALWASLAVLRRNPFMAVRITADAQAVVRRTPFVFVGNNEYRMSGLRASARDSLNRGLLAVYVLNAERRISLLRLALQVLSKGPDEVKELDLLTVEEAAIEVKRHRLQVALDGEVVVVQPPLEYRVRPRALQVHVPVSTTACYPHPVGPSSIRP